MQAIPASPASGPSVAAGSLGSDRGSISRPRRARGAWDGTDGVPSGIAALPLGGGPVSIDPYFRSIGVFLSPSAGSHQGNPAARKRPAASAIGCWCRWPAQRTTRVRAAASMHAAPLLSPPWWRRSPRRCRGISPALGGRQGRVEASGYSPEGTDTADAVATMGSRAESGAISGTPDVARGRIA